MFNYYLKNEEVTVSNCFIIQVYFIPFFNSDNYYCYFYYNLNYNFPCYDSFFGWILIGSYYTLVPDNCYDCYNYGVGNCGFGYGC